MTFGYIKSAIENNLLESYKDQKDFRKSLREFKQNVLNDKSLSKLYSVYDQLSTPQGLSESDANEFLNEGLNVIGKILPSVKLPRTLKDLKENHYQDIDTLVYISKLDLKERIGARKNLIKLISSEPKKIQESIKIPVSSMVKIANQTLENYIQTMDESSKKVFINVIKSDNEKLQEEFQTIKESAVKKLTDILNESTESEFKTTISETIEKIKVEEFSQISFVKLSSLEKNL